MRTVKIAIDATPLVGQASACPVSGIARYTAELARALQAQDQVTLVEPQAGRWWSWGLPRELQRLKPDVFHGTDFAVPYRRVCPSVMTLHDLSPWMDPAWHCGAGRVRRRTPWLLRFGRAAMVITPTEAIRRQAIKHFRLDPDIVRAVPHAAADCFHPVNRPATADFFLAFGTLEPRKNIPRIIDAWRQIRGAELWLIGRKREDAPDLPDEPGLKWLGALSDAVLPEYLAGARAVLYPSLYEGFGLPVLEAMQCGAAVIASTDAAIQEVADEGALYADPRRTDEWVAKMRAVLENRELAAAMRNRAITRAKMFSWTRTAALTRAVYDEARSRCAGLF